MDRQDGEVALQCLGAIGAFGDGQAQQQRVGKEAGKADGHRIRHRAVEKPPRGQIPYAEAGEGPDVEGAKQPQVEGGGKVHLGRVHRCRRKQPAPRGRIAEADHEEDRQDDVQKGGHSVAGPGGRSSTMPS